MRTFNVAKRPLTVLAALLLGFTPSCLRETGYVDTTDNVTGEATVTFAVNVPGNVAPATRGLSVDDETNIETIDILLFNNNESGSRVYYGRVMGVSIDNAPGNTKTFQAVISVNDYSNFDISVVANARDIILNANLIDGSTKSEVLNKLVYTVAAGEKWNSNNIPMWGESVNVNVNANTNLSGANSIKMTRMLSRVDVILSNKAASGENNPVTPNNNNFSLNSVRLYNYSTNGTIAPDLVSGWDSSSNKATAPHPPLGVSYGTVLYEYMVTEPLLYTSADQPLDGGMPTNLRRSIYTLEAPSGSNTQMTKNTCLVIGGYYKNSTDETYYRIDFARKNSLTNLYEYLSLLRNHMYEIKVTEISGAGFEKPEDAFNSLPVNIETEITEWNQGNMGDTVFDGQYLLSIRPSSQIEFGKNSDQKFAEIRTDYPTGWKVTKVTELAANGVTETDITSGNGWLTLPANTVNTYYGADGQYTKLHIGVSENPNNAVRIGYVYIQAGRLTARIEVIQTDVVNSVLAITDMDGNEIDALFFNAAVGYTPEAKTFKVKWTPQSESLYTSVNSSKNPVDASVYDELSLGTYHVKSGTFEAIDDSVYVGTIDSGAGIAEITVAPSAIVSDDIDSNPLYERRTSITFSVITPNGQMNKTIMLQQVVNCAIIDKESFYLANGDWYNFAVKSNCPWKLYFVDNGDGMIEQPTTSTTVELAYGNYNLPWGKQINFKTFDDLSNPTKYTGTGILRLKYQAADGNWYDALETDNTVNLQLFCASGMVQSLANSYIINNNIPILIPVKRANGYRDIAGVISQDPLWTANGYPDQIASDTEYSVELVWSDRTGTGGKGLASDGSTPVKLLQTAGTGDTGYILVQGGVQGNALIAAKVNNKIVWTWHIWVVNYWPYDALGNAHGSGTNDAWMDRNLGATSNGYVPGTSTLQKSAELVNTIGMLYQWGRMTPFIGSREWSTAARAEKGYTESGGDYAFTDNATTISDMRIAISNPNYFYHNASGTSNWFSLNTLWGHNSNKTIYDPCPAGWRVPSFSGSTSPWKSDFSNSTNGMISKSTGGYYPYAGVISTNCKISSASSMGSYWSASYENSTRYYYLYLIGGASTLNNKSVNSYGRSVRCIKE